LICVDRHKFATTIFGRYAALNALRDQRRFFNVLDASGGKETVAEKTAEVLGKRWRFFPTYAALQTGTVLRHISSNA
jgi:hypothetical protein